MKKVYSKPRIQAEAFVMDRPIAANCTADFDDVRSLVELGYFMEGMTCDWNLLRTGGFDYNNDGIADDHDTVCYHSNVQQAFTS